MEMTAFDWLWELNFICCGFWSTERPKQKASNSELKRWFDKGAVIINGKRMKWDEKVSVIESLVLFPKSESRRTSFKFD